MNSKCLLYFYIIMIIIVISLCVWIQYEEDTAPPQDNIIYTATTISDIQKYSERFGKTGGGRMQFPGGYGVFSSYRFILEDGTACTYYEEFDIETERLLLHAQRAKIPVDMVINENRLYHLEIDGEVIVSQEYEEQKVAKEKAEGQNGSITVIVVAAIMLVALFVIAIQNKKTSEFDLRKQK